MLRYEAYHRRAKELVSKMTLEEKISQLSLQSPAIERLGIPSYNWLNEVNGTVTIFPQVIGLAAMFDRKLIKQIAEVIAIEQRAKYKESLKKGRCYLGLNFWGININIFRDPRWARGYETFGEDPYLTSQLGIAFIKGLQGEGHVMKVAGGVKYFAISSGKETCQNTLNAKVSTKDLWETYLPAFEACVKEGGVESVMCGHYGINDQPCYKSSHLFQKILRERWGFKGFVVSEGFAIKDFDKNPRVLETWEEVIVLALNAGCDLNHSSHNPYIRKAYSMGLITEATITQAVEHLITTRFKLGMFDRCAYDDISYQVIDSKSHREVAVEAARKSIVLLQNRGILPLRKEKIRTLGVIGPTANSHLVLNEKEGIAARYITVLEGIQDEVEEDIRVFYAKGCELNKDQKEDLVCSHHLLMEAITVAENSDVVILCLGSNGEREGGFHDLKSEDRSLDIVDLELPKVQRQLLKKIADVGKPIILCLMTGNPMNLSNVVNHCDAILNTWYAGPRGGKAIADILFGKISPSGKLPVTFYQSEDDLPDFTDYSMKKRTYRYIESKPLFSFGFGLTYGDIVCTFAKITSEIVFGEDIEVLIKVVNQGECYTEDVVQLYVKDEVSRYAIKNYSLCGFQRVALKPKEEEIIKIMLPWKALTVVDNKGVRRLDSHQFTLSVGTYQPDERSIELMGRTPILLSLALNE